MKHQIFDSNKNVILASNVQVIIHTFNFDKTNLALNTNPPIILQGYRFIALEVSAATLSTFESSSTASSTPEDYILELTLNASHDQQLHRHLKIASIDEWNSPLLTEASQRLAVQRASNAYPTHNSFKQRFYRTRKSLASCCLHIDVTSAYPTPRSTRYTHTRS